MIPSERLARRGMKVYPTVEKSGKWDRFLNHFHTVTFYGLPIRLLLTVTLKLKMIVPAQTDTFGEVSRLYYCC